MLKLDVEFNRSVVVRNRELFGLCDWVRFV